MASRRYAAVTCGQSLELQPDKLAVCGDVESATLQRWREAAGQEGGVSNRMGEGGTTKRTSIQDATLLKDTEIERTCQIPLLESNLFFWEALTKPGVLDESDPHCWKLNLLAPSFKMRIQLIRSLNTISGCSTSLSSMVSDSQEQSEEDVERRIEPAGTGFAIAKHKVTGMHHQSSQMTGILGITSAVGGTVGAVGAVGGVEGAKD
ncbi:hypothetical protein B0H15DRAFT_935522 [Mycena belliarum]|uniref:Uncharacterized protein n=1 Tax=Mycena belliarum TaxID=1033014 RepID=A0AAD6TK79_9AGAR|nr:hypothetical protein B0H15DRAFT_935522 [Mycena belliae]